MSSNNSIPCKRKAEIAKKVAKKLEQKADTLRIKAYKMKRKDPNSFDDYNILFNRASTIQFRSNKLNDIKPTW